MSLAPLPSLPPPPLEKYIFFALPSMNGPLPAELKFRENTEVTFIRSEITIYGYYIQFQFTLVTTLYYFVIKIML